MTILVSPAEPSAFHHIGKPSAATERHGVDFFWTVKRERDGESETQRWGIQRKAIKDLLASVDDERLAKELAQARSLHQTVLVVEGRLRFTTSGDLVLPGKNFNLRNRWTRTGLWKLLLTVQSRGWWVVFTDDHAGTIEAIRAVESWSRKADHRSLSARPAMQPVLWGRATDREFAVWVLQSAPGVGPEVAGRIYDHFGGGVVELKVSVEELMEVPGVGKKTAETIAKAFGGDGDEREGEA